MQIETKFNVNQKVFCVDKERRLIKKPCNICNSKRTVTLKGKEYKCPECSGKGYGEYKSVYVINEAVVNRINIAIKEKVNITYRCIYDRDKDLNIKEKSKETAISDYENRVFDSYKEADTYCKQMNNGVEYFNNLSNERKTKEICISSHLTIKELAEKIGIKPAQIVKELFLKGEVAQLDSVISYNTALKIADKFGVRLLKEVE